MATNLGQSSSAKKRQNSSTDECIELCFECYRTCIETLSHCLDMGEDHVEKRHVSTLIACSRICQTSAEVMLMGSELHIHTCQSCAQICENCSTSCSSLGDSDGQMMRCAEACNRCADSCRQMAAH